MLTKLVELIDPAYKSIGSDTDKIECLPIPSVVVTGRGSRTVAKFAKLVNKPKISSKNLIGQILIRKIKISNLMFNTIFT